MTARGLVIAKAPVAGEAKTRLGAVIGMEAAADLAAAALLDTLAACAQAFPGACHLALTGDLVDASRGAEIRDALSGWTVFDQVGTTFAERLAHAHGVLASAGTGPVVQIGMDTPQVTPAMLRASTEALDLGSDAVLGPAADGGWWVLALSDSSRARVLAGVPMSSPDTYAATVQALTASGLAVASVGTLRDVDTVADAALVAADAPDSRFALAWELHVATEEEVAS
ncbi:MAG: cofC 2 [Marmoricola sp.]|nr:cofC 2 [Marmoricola sp.]